MSVRLIFAKETIVITCIYTYGDLFCTPTTFFFRWIFVIDARVRDFFVWLLSYERISVKNGEKCHVIFSLGRTEHMRYAQKIYKAKWIWRYIIHAISFLCDFYCSVMVQFRYETQLILSMQDAFLSSWFSILNIYQWNSNRFIHFLSWYTEYEQFMNNVFKLHLSRLSCVHAVLKQPHDFLFIQFCKRYRRFGILTSFPVRTISYIRGYALCKRKKNSQIKCPSKSSF